MQLVLILAPSTVHVFVMSIFVFPGVNGDIVYSILTGDQGGHFVIDPDTGIISVGEALDRETHPYYRVEIKATDQARDPVKRLSGTAVVNSLLF